MILCQAWKNLFLINAFFNYHFFNYKNGLLGPNNFIAELLKCFALALVQTYFLEVGAYLSLKGATTGVWEGRFFFNLTKNITFF